jgi:GT2 family glycosyltransferase
MASSEVLLFLHADVRLGPTALARMCEVMRNPSLAGGNFHIHYEGGDFTARAFTRINQWRRHLGVFYGDSGIFVRKSFFESTGGFQPWPILEDYEFARRLWKSGAVALLEEPIYVSDRRWKKGGLLRTLWQWFWIQGLYFAGVSPHRLAGLYRAVR